jgi:zinc and cadmium transporter
MSYLIPYCVFVTCASMAGGELTSLLRLTHFVNQMLVSLVAGLMLGVGLFHMLPHATIEVESLDVVMLWVMGGLLATFFLIRAFHFHQHGSAEHDGTGHDHGHDHEHDHDHDHGHSQAIESTAAGQPSVGRRRFSWIGMGLGLSIHSMLDGAALAASIRADAHIDPNAGWLGFGIFAAVFLHKPLDAMSITSLMAAGGWPQRQRQIINFGYSLLCPIGAAIFWVGTSSLGGGNQAVIGYALAFFAGVFLCISLSDLLPEVQFHSHDRFWLSAALLMGVSMAWGLRFLEGPHAHQKPGNAQQQQQGK